MGKFEDLTGRLFGRLTVHGMQKTRNVSGRSVIKWLCLCSCGGTSLTVTQNLLSGHTKSCGCLNREITSSVKTKHGGSGTGSYISWSAMKQRCNNPLLSNFKYYGGRGITYDPKWETFEGFYEDMGERPEGLTLERSDNNGNYCKTNCVWENSSVQGFNQGTKKNNKSGRTGVNWHSRDLCWNVSIGFENTQIFLGNFESFESAVDAREQAELKYFGYIKGE